MHYRWLYFIGFWLYLASSTHGFSQATAPDKHVAPDGRHSVEVVPHDPSGNSSDFDATLIVRAGETVLARYLAQDLAIVNDLWSPDGKFVAVEQHTVGGVDRVWVLRLSDGKALKKPETLKPVTGQPLYSEDALAARVHHQFPELDPAAVFKSGAYLKDWTTENKLIIRAVITFRTAAEGASVEIFDTYRLSAKGLHLVGSEMHKDTPEYFALPYERRLFTGRCVPA